MRSPFFYLLLFSACLTSVSAYEKIIDPAVLQVVRFYSKGELESMWIAFGSDYRVCGFILKRRDGSFLVGPEQNGFPGKRFDPSVNVVALDIDRGEIAVQPASRGGAVVIKGKEGLIDRVTTEMPPRVGRDPAGGWYAIFVTKDWLKPTTPDEHGTALNDLYKSLVDKGGPSSVP